MKTIIRFLSELFALRTIEQLRQMPRRTVVARMCLSLAVVPLTLLALLASGCVTVEVEDHDPDCGDVIVVVEPGDETDPEPEPEPEPEPDPEPEPEAARLDLVFGGPPAGTVLAVGASNADALCFTAAATAEEMEIRNFRIEIHSDDGLILNSMRQYHDIKVADTGAPGWIVAGPIDLDYWGSDVTQTLVLIGSRTIEANGSRTFCVRLDVNGNALLDGNSLYVKLLPFEQGDVVLTGDGSELSLDRITPSTALWTSFVLDGPDGPLVPHAAPYISYAALPTTTLPNAGTIVIHRMTITARAEADVLVKKLSYQAGVADSDDPHDASLLDVRLRRVGEGSDLPGLSHVDMSGGADCGFVSSWSNRCIRIVLDEPLAIAAGTSVTVELRITISGAFVSGDSLTTGLVMDAWGHQEGPLVGTAFSTAISGGYEDGMLWSNDGMWFYNGNSVSWGTPFAQTLTNP